MLAIWNVLKNFLAFVSKKINYNLAIISEETCTLRSRDVYEIMRKYEQFKAEKSRFWLLSKLIKLLKIIY